MPSQTLRLIHDTLVAIQGARRDLRGFNNDFRPAMIEPRTLEMIERALNEGYRELSRHEARFAREEVLRPGPLTPVPVPVPAPGLQQKHHALLKDLVDIAVEWGHIQRAEGDELMRDVGAPRKQNILPRQGEVPTDSAPYPAPYRGLQADTVWWDEVSTAPASLLGDLPHISRSQTWRTSVLPPLAEVAEQHRNRRTVHNQLQEELMRSLQRSAGFLDGAVTEPNRPTTSASTATTAPVPEPERVEQFQQSIRRVMRRSQSGG